MFVLCKCTTLQFLEDIYIKNKTLKKHKNSYPAWTSLLAGFLFPLYSNEYIQSTKPPFENDPRPKSKNEYVFFVIIVYIKRKPRLRQQPIIVTALDMNL